MKIGNKHIPLMITSGLSLVALYMSSSISLNSFMLDAATLLGTIGVGLTWLSIFLKRKIWVYLLIALYILSFTSYINLSSINFSLIFGSVEINLFTLALLIAHFIMNFSDPEITAPPVPEGGWTKVNVIKHEYQDKSDAELSALLEEELSPEKRQALEEILESRKIH